MFSFGLFLFSGYFPLAPVYCLAWICLDVLFCTASIMHLCTISVDRYLSLRYPMSFGRNKTRRRVTLKILVVWILSFALSLPLSLMYSQVRNGKKKCSRLFFFLGQRYRYIGTTSASWGTVTCLRQICNPRVRVYWHCKFFKNQGECIWDNNWIKNHIIEFKKIIYA